MWPKVLVNHTGRWTVKYNINNNSMSHFTLVVRSKTHSFSLL